jgi:hypothetical protein
MPDDGMSGGERLQRYLDGIVQRSSSAKTVSVGFLEGPTYPDGRSVAANAALQEFGGTIHHDAGSVTLYRKMAAAGTHFLRNGRFVKRKDANFSSTHARRAYSQTIPPRPFFRNAIRKYGPQWGADMAAIIKANGFDAARVLSLMGMRIKGQIQQSIVDLRTPPNAPSTIRRKGFDKPLIEKGHMLNSVDYEVHL